MRNFDTVSSNTLNHSESVSSLLRKRLHHQAEPGRTFPLSDSILDKLHEYELEAYEDSLCLHEQESHAVLNDLKDSPFVKSAGTFIKASTSFARKQFKKLDEAVMDYSEKRALKEREQLKNASSDDDFYEESAFSTAVDKTIRTVRDNHEIFELILGIFTG